MFLVRLVVDLDIVYKQGLWKNGIGVYCFDKVVVYSQVQKDVKWLVKNLFVFYIFWCDLIIEYIVYIVINVFWLLFNVKYVEIGIKVVLRQDVFFVYGVFGGVVWLVYVIDEGGRVLFVVFYDVDFVILWLVDFIDIVVQYLECWLQFLFLG